VRERGGEQRTDGEEHKDKANPGHMGNSKARRNEGFFVYLLAAAPESVFSRVDTELAQSRPTDDRQP
jgi:hypothetical protein